MANSKLIIVEGAQGAGKTTVTNYLRHSLKYTNLYRLCGTSDSTKEGKNKAKIMYDNLLQYMKGLENQSINLVFDRTFFTEEIYCRLGYKEYTFSDEYERLLHEFSKLDFDIYYITLYLENENNFEARLKREDKAVPEYAKFEVKKSLEQQREYLKMADEIKEKYSNIKVFNISNDEGEDSLKIKLKEILNY